MGVFGNNAMSIVKREIDFLKRRGPDNQAIYDCGNGLILGAARLAMTDPHERSNQPMINKENHNAILLNGEIYNFKELRNILKKENHVFSTESDTEVVLKSLSRDGIKSVTNFEGMFAIAYLDFGKNTLTLIRDFLGKKPLYFHLSKHLLIFSSQIDTIQRNVNSLNLNSKSLYTYLKLGYILDPESMYNEINSVKPGEIIEIDLKKLTIKSKSTYCPVTMNQTPDSSIRQTLQNAVDRRIDGHSNFALSLSGGVDSSIIALSILDKIDSCTAYSMRWIDSDKNRYNSDSYQAEIFAKKLGLKFKFVDMPSVKKIPDLLDEFIMAMHEPNSNPTGLSMMVLYSKISEDNHRLVLTGDGSDEIFGGYERYNHVKKFQNFPEINLKLFNLITNYFQKPNFITKSLTSLIPSDKNEFWLYWHQINSNKKIKNVVGIHEELNLTLDHDLDTLYFHLIKQKRIPKLMQKDLFFWLTMESNRKLDRVSMWYSLEARSPFQDEKVISIGIDSMRKNMYQSLNKQILKGAYPELYKLNYNSSIKQGFMSPLGHWLRNNPDLIMDSMRYLTSNLSFPQKIVSQLSKAPELGRYYDFNILWSLIVLSRWHSLKFRTF